MAGLIERESRQLKREGSLTAYNLRTKNNKETVTLGASTKNLTEEKKDQVMDFLGGGDIADFYKKRVTS